MGRKQHAENRRWGHDPFINSCVVDDVGEQKPIALAMWDPSSFELIGDDSQPVDVGSANSRDGVNVEVEVEDVPDVENVPDVGVVYDKGDRRGK